METNMLITEIFRNYQPEDSDNAKCIKCQASFTVPFVAAKQNSSLACPNCGEMHNANEAIANNESDQQDADPIGGAEGL